MGYSDNLDTMWTMVWGDNYTGALIVILALVYLCSKKKYDVSESFVVIFPTIIGIASGLFAEFWWVWALFVLFMGALAGMAVLKYFGRSVLG